MLTFFFKPTKCFCIQNFFPVNLNRKSSVSVMLHEESSVSFMRDEAHYRYCLLFSNYCANDDDSDSGIAVVSGGDCCNTDGDDADNDNAGENDNDSDIFL